MESQFHIQWIPTEQLDSILPLAFLLNGEKISMDVLRSRLQEMIPMGYQCVGVYDEGQLIGICGVWLLNKLYVGKHVEPDNVIIDPAYQGKGIGNLMMEFVFNYAKEIGCEGAEVNCYKTNTKGMKYWQSHGYQPLAYHLFKSFKDE